MSLTPVIYVDNETVIGATNLNAIQDAILANEQGLATKVNSSDYSPTAKTSAMTQAVGKDSNGQLWTEPSGGGAGLIIRGYYPTLQALQQAVPNPNLGDTYGVGSQAPYEIYMWSGSAWVDNGTIKGEKGDDGEDGFSPAVTITQTQTGHDVNITDKTHPSGQTFSVNNGTNGTDGEDGDDGFSPVVSSTPIAGGTRVSIQDATHTETFDVLNGTGSGDMQISVYDPQSAVATAGGIPAYVNANGGKIDHIQLNGTEQTITNKTVNLTPSATDIAYGQTTVNAELSSHYSQIVQLDSTVGGHTTSITNLQTDVATKITNPSGGEVGNVLKKTASGVEWGEGGGGSADTYLLVFCQVGDSVTVTDNGSYTETKTLSTGTSLRFDLPSLGIYYATCDSHSATVDATFYGKYELDFRAFTFGISRSTSSSSVAWTRTDDSVGFSVSASVGTTAGHSDFDDYPIYREIERVTLNTGDVMVKIPKFYCRRYVENGTEYIKISNRQQTGFIVHPAFQHNGNTQEYIYVGAYKTTSGHYSKTGLAPLVNLTRASFRSNASAKGSGWSQVDITTLSAIEMLMMVEFATNDMQSAIGEGWSASSHSGAINTGTCDAVPNLTGRPSGTSNNVDVVYRGIEGFWGNVWEWFDGLNWNGGAYWICNNQSNFADDTSTNYTQLGYNGGSTGWSSSYITAMGCDLNNQAIILPTTAGSGSATTYYADAVWSSTGWRVAERGGGWTHGSLDGLFTLAVNDASSSAYSNIGSRLLYIPSN